jgi:HEAT repeat protein
VRARLIALLTLGHLGDYSAWDDILRLSREPDALLSLAAARALLQINADHALHELMPQLLHRDDWQTAQLALLIEENGTDKIYAYLADATARLSGSLVPPYLDQLRRLLRLLEVAPPQHALPAVRRVLAETADDEVVAACLKFLREPADLPAVRSRLDHANWIVRLQAARALGRIGGAEDVPRLKALLSDPVWWVRYRTAQALRALMHGDKQALAQLHDSLIDRYARDMLEMVMAEGMAQ